jgi:hypothetical protein
VVRWEVVGPGCVVKVEEVGLEGVTTSAQEGGDADGAAVGGEDGDEGGEVLGVGGGG